jgi:ABC-type transport system substrate-binding protein
MIPRRIPFLLIALGVLILCLSLWPTGTSSKSEVGDNAFRSWKLPVPAPIPLLNPQNLVDFSDKSLALLIFSRLVRTDEYMEVLPDLLENWSFDLSKGTATLRIRQGARFHDGKPVLAEDLAFSFHYWAQGKGLDNNLLFLIKGAEEFAEGKISAILGIQIVDSRTLSVQLKQPAPEQFISHLAQPRFCIYPKDFRGLDEKEFFTKPIGTGPFKMVSYQPERAEFIANEAYHLGRPRLNSISVIHLNVDSAVSAFKIGEVDNLIMFQPRDPVLLKAPGVVVKRLPRTSTLAVILNSSHPDFKQEANRQLVASVIRHYKKEVSDRCYPGSEIAQSYIPPNFMGHIPLTDPPELPVRAPKWRTNLTFYASPSENGDCVLKTLKPGLSEIGIASSSRDMQHLFSLLQQKKLHLWAETFVFKSDEAYYNLGYFTTSSPEFLLGIGVPFLDQTFARLSVPGLSSLERGHLYHQMDRVLLEQAHLVPIAHFSQSAVFRSRVRNLEFLSTGRFAANWHQIEVGTRDDESL